MWGSSADNLSVLWPYQSAGLLVMPYILQFYNQEWHPRNPVLGAVIYITNTGHSFNPHSIAFPPLFTNTFQFRLHFNFNVSVTNLLYTYMWDNQYALPHSDVQ